MARRLLAVAVCALALARPRPLRSTAPCRQRRSSTGKGTSCRRRSRRPPTPRSLTKQRSARRSFERDPKVAAWLDALSEDGRVDEETYDAKTSSWTVKIWWGKAGEIAEGNVDDASGVVTEAWTGPQVAWKMARGYNGAFGGAKINNPWLWGVFCLVFFVGLADFRRLLSLRNLDLADAALADGVALVLQPRRRLHGGAALLPGARSGSSSAASGSASPAAARRRAPFWPAWILLAATVFLAGFRIGLNVEASNVIDVGYSGVIGAERIAQRPGAVGELPDRGQPEGVRRRPTRRARSASASRRTAAASRRTRRATRTARSRTRRTSPATSSSAGAASGTRFRRRTSRRSRSTCCACSGCGSSGGASAGCSSRPRLPSRGLRTRSRSTRRTRTRTTRCMPCLPHLGLLARLVAGRAAARSPRCRAGRSSRRSIVAPLWLDLSGAAAVAALPRRLRGRDARGVLGRAARAEPAARAAGLLGPHVRWQVGRDSPLSLWDWGQYHAQRAARTCTSSSACCRCSSSSARSPSRSSRGASRRSSSPRSPLRCSPASSSC